MLVQFFELTFAPSQAVKEAPSTRAEWRVHILVTQGQIVEVDENRNGEVQVHKQKKSRRFPLSTLFR